MLQIDPARTPRALPPGLGSILRTVSTVAETDPAAGLLRVLDDEDRVAIATEILATRRRRERERRQAERAAAREAALAAGLAVQAGVRRRLFDLLDSYRAHAQAAPRKRPATDGRAATTYPARIACCGHQRHDSTTELVELGQGAERRAQWVGIIRCRSKACPYCLAVRKSNDGETIRRVCADHHDVFGHAQTLMATFTIRHENGDALADTWRGVRAAWRKMLQGRAWAGSAERTTKRGKVVPAVDGARDRWSLGDFVVGEECTHGINGWHAHLHILILPRRELSRVEIRDAADWLAQRWQQCVRDVLGPQHVPDREHGTDLRPCHQAEYVAKLGVDLGAVGAADASRSLELADPGHKRGRRPGQRSPLELLGSWCDAQDARALVLYQTFERATRGTRDLTWSKSLRYMRDNARHHAREEWKAERAAARTVAVFPPRVHDAVVALRGQHLCDLQEQAEARGLVGVVELLRGLVGPEAAARVEFLTAQHASARELTRGVFDTGPPFH